MIFITGITGFIGTNLKNYLTQYGFEVYGFSLRNSQFSNNIKTQAQAIIHLAGKAHDIKNTSDPSDYFEVNTKLTQKVFDIFLESNCKDFIFFSSVKAVTDKSENSITEETLLNPKSPYGQSKLKAEQYILSKPLPKDKRVFILRPTMIHGPGNKGNLNLLYQLVKIGIPWPLGVFNNQRSFCSIDNVCFIVQQILENKELSSGIYNLADDESLSTNEIIKLIAVNSNKKVRILIIPIKIISAVAKIGTILRLPLNSERLDKLTENFVVSNQKIKDALKIEKMPTSALNGMTKTFQSFKNN